MSPSTLVPLAGTTLSIGLALASVFRKRTSLPTWFFSAGMMALAAESACLGLGFRASDPDAISFWMSNALRMKSVTPAIWLLFSLTYSRGEYQRFLSRWRLPLVALTLGPLIAFATAPARLVDVVAASDPDVGFAVQSNAATRMLSSYLVVAFGLVLANLEHTFRAAIGTMRWRVKFVMVALVVILGADIYVRSQTILFSSQELGLYNVQPVALVIGCILLIVAYVRGWSEIEVYPSLAVLRSSISLLVVGGYLLTVGALAQLVRRFGGAEYFQLQAAVVLAGLSGLAVLLLSDRFRHRVRSFAVRHFRKAQHDSAQIWTLCSHRLATVRDMPGLCAASVRLISETFDVLSVSMWLIEGDTLVAGASTAHRGADVSRHPVKAVEGLLEALATNPAPLDLEEERTAWAEQLRQLNTSAFAEGGHRWCVPLQTGSKVLGVLVLADRVNGTIYTLEEQALLACIANQVTSALLNQHLTDEVSRAKEFEAFRTMSAFFVHDLKNAASSLNLTLKNLPVHFDDPAFRADALRLVGNTAKHIDEVIARLSEFRRRPEVNLVEADLNELITGAVKRLGDMPNVELTSTLQRVPPVLADREQIQSVVSNLVLNARDAVGSGGHVHVRTEHDRGRVVLSVTDDGCGMSPAFLRDSLFRPFQSTKPKGLGIGLFQSRAIVHAHGGSVLVDSAPGQGTTFQVILPIMEEQ